jgi:dipeptidyl aminopeptidase/acylaminoacyl peptidase
VPTFTSLRPIGVAACAALALYRVAAADTAPGTGPVAVHSDSVATAAKRVLTPDDVYLTESVSDPQISPDGQWIAYLLTTNDRESDEIRGAIWMVSWDGTHQLQLTAPATGTAAPRWSPDGRHLAYVGKRADTDHAQLMLLDRRGGEPRALTHVAKDISGYAWSPDGQRLVLVLEGLDGPAVSDNAATGTSAAQTPRPIVIDSLYFKEDVTGYIDSRWRQHLYLYDLDSAQLQPLAFDAASNDLHPAWSPDSSKIAFVRTHERLENTDGTQELEVVEARADATPRTLARPYAPNFQNLAWSPDGRQVAFLQGRELKYYIYLHDELATVPAAGGAPRALTARLDRAIMGYQYAPDGTAIQLLVEDDRAQYPARLQLANLAIERQIARPLVVTGQSLGGAHQVLVASDDVTASEIYAFEAGGLRRLTHHGDRLLDQVQLGASEDFEFRSRDGTEIHGMLVKPPGYVAGRRYPTIIWLHGGPDLQDDHSADFDSYQFRRQWLAARGYLLVGINYRGSSGRGFDFASAIFADWGHKEVEDILAGVDALVARGLADPERLGIGGWSYGGMLTDYTIASDTRFRAGMAGAGSGNVISIYGTDQYVLWYNAELGYPWRNPALWMKVSYPFFHADRIRTPTLFMSGDRDYNVPVAGAEQMYTALRTLGVPTELVVYPDQPHELVRPSYLKDRFERAIAWYDRFLKPAH